MLWFGSVPTLEDELLEHLAREEGVSRVVIHCQGLGRIDLTGAWTLVEMLEEIRSAGITIAVAGVPDHARRVFHAVGEERWRGSPVEPIAEGVRTMMTLSFLGAAGTVTGSRHLLTTGSRRILVDCGLFQGLKALRLRNRDPFPFDPASLDAVVLTHAHLDHTGLLPVLVKKGYTGPIYCTEPTEQLVRILLADSGHLQEEDARYANKKGFSRHSPAQPLYTEEEARRVGDQLRPVPMGAPTAIDGATLTFTVAGHILGAASVHLRTDGGAIALQRGHRPSRTICSSPRRRRHRAADFVVMESTYGGREHPLLDPESALALVLKRTVRRGGVLMVPSFAVGRAQLVLYVLSASLLFRRDSEGPRLPEQPDGDRRHRPLPGVPGLPPALHRSGGRRRSPSPSTRDPWTTRRSSTTAGARWS